MVDADIGGACGHRYQVGSVIVASVVPPHEMLWCERIRMSPRGGVNRRFKIITVKADRKSTRLNSSHSGESRMPSSA